LKPAVVEADINRLGPGDRVWAAISHLNNVPLGAWTAASRRGAKLNLIVHESERRVPERVIERLAGSGINIRRYRHPSGLPMHAKFFLLARADERVSYFGSFNFNLSSRYFNQELLVRSTNRAVFKALRARFNALDREVQQQQQQQRSVRTTDSLRRPVTVVN
jgi:phosphatidylserine/phosphatidylglycerophosphate/cardiolipin synthase-like enzyme